MLLSLGLDTFAVAVGLGISGLNRRQQLRFGLSFAVAEGAMPIVGFALGRVLATAIGSAAAYLAGALLLAVGVYMIWEAREGEKTAYLAASPTRLVLVALSVSIDELAIGFGLGLLGIPLVLAVAFIAVQAFAVTLVGTTIGRIAGAALGKRAHLASGFVLSLLAIVLLFQKVL